MDRLTYFGTHEAKPNVTIQDVCNKLGTYEDMKEQGMLLILPCRPGDTVYVLEKGNYWKKIGVNCTRKIGINEVVTARVECICSSRDKVGEVIWCIKVFGKYGSYLFPFEEIGKTVFLTEKKVNEAKEAMEGIKQ